MSSSVDSLALQDWFRAAQRLLPWRQNPSPYEVWVSEVMLQQTQVAVVIPYFLSWMKRFPTIVDLAVAPQDEVIKVWEGLGYYSRARNLRAGAQMVVEQFNGKIPSDESSLLSIKGIGPYTVGAIRAFAFKERALALDGNVMRVLSRYFFENGDITLPAVQKSLRQRGVNWLPENEPWLATEGLIELGARLCKKRPKCTTCPLRSGCKARQAGKELELPVRRKQSATTPLFRAVAVIRTAGQLLLQRGKPGRIMSDLYEFPYVETGKLFSTSDQLAAHFPLPLTDAVALPIVKHSFTRYRVCLKPILFHAEQSSPISGCTWKPLTALPKLSFSAGHRRILQQLQHKDLL